MNIVMQSQKEKDLRSFKKEKNSYKPPHSLRNHYELCKSCYFELYDAAVNLVS